MNQITPNTLYELDLGGTMKLIGLCRTQLKWRGPTIILVDFYDCFPLDSCLVAL
jgi:hypothetical protein